MEKFFYKHFGDEVPTSIEREYNRLLIQEYNQEVREQKYRVQTLEFCEVAEFFPDPASLPVYELELEKERLHRKRLEYLKVTMAALAEVHSMSVDKIRYRIGLAKSKLKEYYDLHEKRM